MCVVSAVIDSGKQPWLDRWDNIQPLPYITATPYIPPTVVIPQPFKDDWKEFKDIIDRLDRLDKSLGQPDCDETKRDWIKKIDAKIAEIEKKVNKKRIK